MKGRQGDRYTVSAEERHGGRSLPPASPALHPVTVSPCHRVTPSPLQPFTLIIRPAIGAHEAAVAVSAGGGGAEVGVPIARVGRQVRVHAGGQGVGLAVVIRGDLLLAVEVV